MKSERRLPRMPTARCARLAPSRPASQTRPRFQQTIPSARRFSYLPESPRTRKVSLPPSLVPMTLAPRSSGTAAAVAYPSSPPGDQARICELGCPDLSDHLYAGCVEEPEPRCAWDVPQATNGSDNAVRQALNALAALQVRPLASTVGVEHDHGRSGSGKRREGRAITLEGFA